MAYVGGEVGLKLLSQQKPNEKLGSFIENNQGIMRSVLGLAGFAVYEGFQAVAKGHDFDWRDMAAYTVSTLLWSHKQDVVDLAMTTGQLLEQAANAVCPAHKGLKP